MRISDWSSDVCSSDLRGRRHAEPGEPRRAVRDDIVVLEHPPLIAGDRCPRRPAESGRDHPRHRLGKRNEQPLDRKSVVQGKSVSVRVDLGGRRIIKKKKKIASSATRVQQTTEN